MYFMQASSLRWSSSSKASKLIMRRFFTPCKRRNPLALHGAALHWVLSFDTASFCFIVSLSYHAAWDLSMIFCKEQVETDDLKDLSEKQSGKGGYFRREKLCSCSKLKTEILLECGFRFIIGRRSANHYKLGFLYPTLVSIILLNLGNSFGMLFLKQHSWHCQRF